MPDRPQASLSKLRVFWLAAALAAAALALLWTFVWPEEAASATGLRHLAARWGHAAAWLFLSAGSLLRFLDKGSGKAARAASSAFTLGGLSYLAFVAATYLAG